MSFYPTRPIPGLKISASNNGSGFIPRFAGRSSGMDQSNFGIDGALPMVGSMSKALLQ